MFVLRPRYSLRCEPLFEGRKSACKTKEMASVQGGVAIVNHCAIVILLRIVKSLRRSILSTAGSFGKGRPEMGSAQGNQDRKCSVLTSLGNLFPSTCARLSAPHLKTHSSHVRAASEPRPNRIRSSSAKLGGAEMTKILSDNNSRILTAP